MGCRYGADRGGLAATPFRRESLLRYRSLFSSDRQSQVGQRAFVPEIFQEPIRSCIYRECSPDPADLAQPVRYSPARKPSDKNLTASCSACPLRGGVSSFAFLPQLASPRQC